jgi:hypothetical protein
MGMLHFPKWLSGSCAVLASALAAATTAHAQSAIRLTAEMTSPVDVVLRWTNSAPGAAEYVVEYAYQPEGPYTVLADKLPGETTYEHPRLIPETTFYYRVRPVYGPASDPVEACLPESLSGAEYAKRYDASENNIAAEPQILPQRGPIRKKSIRDRVTAAEGGPSNLKVQLLTPTISEFKLTWTDHATDEEGFLLETKADGEKEFRVCAVYEPNINCVVRAFEPPQRRGWFRIRAYYYGAPSNMVSKRTGKEPPQPFNSMRDDR